MNKRTLTFIALFLIGILVYSKSPALGKVESHGTATKATWDKNIPRLKNEDEIDKTSRLVTKDYNQLIESSLNLIQDKSVIENEYENLGIYDPFSPKLGRRHIFGFLTQKTQTIIYTNIDTDEIQSINISANHMGIHPDYPVDLSKIDFQKLQLEFLTNEIIGEGDILSIKKIYLLNQNPNIQVIFINNYSNQPQSNYIGKAKFDYDVKHIDTLNIFQLIKVMNKK